MASREYQKGFLAAVRYVGTRLRAADTKGINYELGLVTLNARHGIFPAEDEPGIVVGMDLKKPGPPATEDDGTDPVPREPIEQKPKRTRRTSAQIAADRAAAAEEKARDSVGVVNN